MGKKSKLDKLNEWIKAEYDRETQEIEDSLSNDGSFDPDRVDSEALFQRIQARIKEQEEQKENLKVQEKKRVRINRYQVGKYAAFFCVAIIAVFLASMTSEANRSYLKYTVQYWVGNEMIADVGNEKDEKSDIEWKEQKQARQQIEAELGIPVPGFRYKLEIGGDDAYNIQYGNAVAIVEYKYDDSIVNLRMVNQNKADISGIDFQGSVIDKLKVKGGAIEIVVLEIKDTEDKEPRLVAQWKYKDGYYQLSGKVKTSEFIKIVKSIFY